MSNILNDLRFALRQLRRSPVFALTAVLTLALGIGANTAIFSLLDQALLSALPVQRPRELVILQYTGDAWEGSTHNHGGDPNALFSYPLYKDLVAQNQAFSGILATNAADIGLTRRDSSLTARAELVSGNYFNLLGVKPFLGRLLMPADDERPNGSPVVVLGYEFWRNQLGADASILNSTVGINGHPFQVVGVAPPSFRSAIWGESPAVFTPLTMMDTIIPGTGIRLTRRNDRSLNLIARLKPNETREEAAAALAPLWHALRADELKALGTESKPFVDEFLTHSRLLVLPGARGYSYQRGDFEKPLLAVMGMAALVLLIACVNVASLLLVRAAGRVREFALRYALGAGGGRVAQQLLLEGLLIGVAGGAAGIALAPLAVRALVQQLQGDAASVAFSTAVDGRVLALNFAVALFAAILFSLAPLFQLRRGQLTATMSQKSATGSGAALSLRRAVVCLQIGLSVLLLTASGLFVRTMQNLRHVNVGFATAHLVTFGINPRLAGYTPDRVPALHQRVLETMSALPGVQALAATDDPELADDNHGGNITVQGYVPHVDEDLDVEEPFINTTYFSALQIPLLAGRTFTEDDNLTHPKVGIVNEAFAKHVCGTPQACLGRMMASGGGDVKLDTQIVGVVGDARHTGIRQPVKPTWFRPLRQNLDPARLYCYLRTSADPAQTLASVRRSLQQLDPALTPVALRTMDHQIDDLLSNERMVALLAIAFGSLATLLAGIGLYGVLAYSTAQRTREIGIRIALGSSRVAISSIVLGDVLRLAGIALALSIPLALLLARLLRSQLFGVSPVDPVTVASVVVLVGAVALLSALIPAARAAAVNPTEALRTE
jgi:predicted permease